MVHIYPLFKLFQRYFASMRVLNVAEKNEAAKNIAAILGRGRATRVGFPDLTLFLVSERVIPSLIKFMSFP